MICLVHLPTLPQPPGAVRPVPRTSQLSGIRSAAHRAAARKGGSAPAEAAAARAAAAAKRGGMEPQEAHELVEMFQSGGGFLDMEMVVSGW